MLQTSRKLGRIFNKEPLCAFRRQKNLKDMLVSSRLVYLPEEEKKVPQHRNTTCPTNTASTWTKAKQYTSPSLKNTGKERLDAAYPA